MLYEVITSSAVKEEEQIQVMLRVNDAEQAKLRLVRMEELRVVGIDPDRNQVTIAVHDRDIPNVIDVLRNEGVALYRIEEMKESLEDEFRITSYNVCYTKLLRGVG